MVLNINLSLLLQINLRNVMWNTDLFKHISELKESNPRIWEDITVVKCDNESVEKFKTNKALIYHNWPYLADVMSHCDIVIIDNTNNESNESSLEENLESPDCPAEEEGNQPNICDQCGKSFVSPAKLKKHRKNAHQEVACNVCARSFGSPGALKRHTEIHLNKELTCEICGKVISFSSHYERHMQTHFASNKFECSKCPLKFGTRQGLKQHEQTHNLESFKCHLCNKCFNVKRYLSQHLKKCALKP